MCSSQCKALGEAYARSGKPSLKLQNLNICSCHRYDDRCLKYFTDFVKSLVQRVSHLEGCVWLEVVNHKISVEFQCHLYIY
jgi:hypothetical protein